MKATVEGTHEVAGAVIASTLTTVAVFLPIVFVEGIAGQLFKDQALTVTLSLLASLVVAITMIPMLAALGRQKSADKLSMPDFEQSPQTLGAFSRAYDRIVRAALRRKWATIAIAFGIFAASLAGVRLLGTQLIPQISEGEFFFEVNMPEGTPLTATDQVMKTMETAAAAEPGVETVFSTVGSRLVAGGHVAQHQGREPGAGQRGHEEPLRRRRASWPPRTASGGASKAFPTSR